jgi:hypothetical protein
MYVAWVASAAIVSCKWEESHVYHLYGLSGTVKYNDKL